MKYDTYWYRSITLVPLGDGFPWWKVKNSRSDGLLYNSCCALKSSFVESRRLYKRIMKNIHIIPELILDNCISVLDSLLACLSLCFQLPSLLLQSLINRNEAAQRMVKFLYYFSNFLQLPYVHVSVKIYQHIGSTQCFSIRPFASPSSAFVPSRLFRK